MMKRDLKQTNLVLSRLWVSHDFQFYKDLVEETINYLINDLKNDSHTNENYDFNKEAVRTAYLRGRINAMESMIDLAKKANDRLKALSERELKEKEVLNAEANS